MGFPNITDATRYAGGPSKRIEVVRAGEAITKGEPVKFADATEIATIDDTFTEATLDGVWVVDCEASAPVCGVALEAAAAGEAFPIQVKGFCDYVKTDGGVAEGNFLIPGAGVADSLTQTATDTQTGIIWAVFGYALAADSASNVATSVILDCHGW